MPEQGDKDSRGETYTQCRNQFAEGVEVDISVGISYDLYLGTEARGRETQDHPANSAIQRCFDSLNPSAEGCRRCVDF